MGSQRVGYDWPRLHTRFQKPHLRKYVEEASISIPEILRKISIMSTSNALSTTNKWKTQNPVLKLRDTLDSEVICVVLQHSLEKAMAPHSSTLAWKIRWTEEFGRLQSMGLQKVGHDWATSLSLFTFMHWRRKWQPTPMFLPGESQGQRSLVGCSPWGRKESDMTKLLHSHFSLSCIGKGNGNPLQCSCLENSRDGGAWWAAVYGVAQSRTRLKRLSSSTSTASV